MNKINRIGSQIPVTSGKIPDKPEAKQVDEGPGDTIDLSGSSGQIDAKKRKTISDMAKSGLSKMESLSYYSHIAKRARSSLKSILNEVPGDSREAILAGTALKAQDDAALSAAAQSALKVLGAGIQGPIGATLATAGMKAVSYSSFKYYSHKNAAGRPFIESIEEHAPTGSNEAILVKTAGEIKDDGGTRTAAYKAAFKVISSGTKEPLTSALAKAGLDASYFCFKYYAHRIETSHPFLGAIEKHAGANSNEAILAKTAQKVKSGGGPKVAAYEAVFKTISSGVKAPLITSLAKAGLEASTFGFKYYSHRIEASHPFLGAIEKHAGANSNEAILARTAQKVKSDGGPKTAAYEAAFSTISSGSKAPLTTSLAKAGLKALSYDFKFVAHQIEAAHPFLEAINKYSKNPREKEMIKKVINGKPDYDSIKKALQDIVRLYEKAKPIADMIDHQRDLKEGKTGANKEIVVRENVVNIGGVELPRSGHRTKDS